jgi:hypothetical protein
VSCEAVADVKGKVCASRPQIVFVTALAHGVYVEYNSAVNGECQ